MNAIINTYFLVIANVVKLWTLANTFFVLVKLLVITLVHAQVDILAHRIFYHVLVWRTTVFSLAGKSDIVLVVFINVFVFTRLDASYLQLVFPVHSVSTLVSTLIYTCVFLDKMIGLAAAYVYGHISRLDIRFLIRTISSTL